MNREILFRGKRLDNGKWITGQLLKFESGRAMICESHSDIFCYERDTGFIQTVVHEVDPSTVGQYTGLKDKHGRKIFIGDICKAYYFYFDSTGKVEAEAISEIAYDGMGLTFKISYLADYVEVPERLEVLGNIFDNPELLEESNL